MGATSQMGMGQEDTLFMAEYLMMKILAGNTQVQACFPWPIMVEIPTQANSSSH